MVTKVTMATKFPMATKIQIEQKVTNRTLSVFASYEIWACLFSKFSIRQKIDSFKTTLSSREMVGCKILIATSEKFYSILKHLYLLQKSNKKQSIACAVSKGYLLWKKVCNQIWRWTMEMEVNSKKFKYFLQLKKLYIMELITFR